jgi:hypothetical protein
VLHDAGMDARTPTHELTRAHAVLQARRRLAAAPSAWALSSAGLDTLQGKPDRSGPVLLDSTEAGPADDSAFNQLLASVDAANARVTAALPDQAPPSHPSARALNPLVYDPDCDETLQLEQWRDIVKETRTLPPTLAAAIALAAWRAIAPLQHARWLGPLLAAALLRDRGKARHHLPCLHEGLSVLLSTMVPAEQARPPQQLKGKQQHCQFRRNEATPDHTRKGSNNEPVHNQTTSDRLHRWKRPHLSSQNVSSRTTS